MKPQELKIGNLVCYNGEVVKVEQVTKRKIGYHTIPNETRMNYARLCKIEPIPITEKLLTKRIGGDKVTYFISHGNSMLTFKKLDDALWDVLIQVSFPNYREIRQYVYNIQYIHQLQNAYYLVTGEELEIKV
jgi:hypothetical protein